MTIEVRNPRTGDVDHTFDPPGAEDVARLASRLREAQPGWGASGAPARAEVLRAWADAIGRRRGEIVDALVADTGRRAESELEVNAVIGSLQRWADLGVQMLGDQPERDAAIPGIRIGQTVRPYPVVGVISPWNFPLLLSMIDTIPALMAGCAVVVKPSEITPRFVEPLLRSIEEAGSLGAVLALVPGDGRTGSALVDSVDLVCFTGSVPTGRRVAEQAAARFIPAFLELGGKDPAVVLASADLDRATSAILWGSTANAGQSCQSIERVYVDRSIVDPFLEMLVDKARSVRLAHPTPSDGEIGPIIAGRQVDVITDHLADATARGATVLCEGAVEYLDGGAYVRPTVLTGVDHTMKVMTEETFGPLIPVMAYSDVDEAVHLANDTVYGLSAAVFAGTSDEALDIARHLDAGAVSINDAALTALVHDAEKNSFRLSGLGGSRMGPAALTRFGRRQAFLISRGAEPDPWWHPQLRGS